MTSILRELSLSYAVLSEGHRRGSACALREPSPVGPLHGVLPITPFARAATSRRSPESSTPRVRLHLQPGQKGTKQLLAQYVGRGIQSAGSGSCATIACSRSASTAESSTNPHPMVDASDQAERIFMQMPGRHLDRDACIRRWMPASHGR